jgi:hypothetical protein
MPKKRQQRLAPDIAESEWLRIEAHFGVNKPDSTLRDAVDRLRSLFAIWANPIHAPVRPSEIWRDLQRRYNEIRKLRQRLEPKDFRGQAIRTFADNRVRKAAPDMNFGFDHGMLLQIERALARTLEGRQRDIGGRTARSGILTPVIEGLARLWTERKGNAPSPPHWNDIDGYYGNADFLNAVTDVINSARPDHGFARRTVVAAVQRVLRTLKR